MNDEPALSGGKAWRTLRDRFREALHADDYATLRVLSVELRNCTHVLPRAECLSLGLPRGSTYAMAAKTIVAS